jgi:protein-tyrosine kinase
MSRIHEALKKAKEERAAAESTDSVAVPAEPQAALLEPPIASSPGASGGTPRGAEIGPPRTSYLRFDDLRKHCAHPHWHLDPNLNAFSNSAPNPHSAEQFRTLRSRLYQMRNGQPLRTLMITSSLPAEGKTFLTNNLAQAIVRQPDRRALIIDADLRCSRLHVALGAPSTPGLTNYLRGEADEVAIIQQGQDGNLCLIPGGDLVTNPSELLMNGRLKMLLDRVTPIFDWVILDSPPCLAVADASIMAEHCDGILLVVRAASTPSEIAQRACQELQGRKVVGVVLNAVQESDGYGSYYYSPYGYGQSDAKVESK